MTKQIEKCGTKVEWSEPKEEQAYVSLDIPETKAVHRFALASRDELNFQASQATQDPALKPQEIDDIKNAAHIISSWLSNVIDTCESNLESISNGGLNGANE